MTQVNTPYALPKLRPIQQLTPALNAYFEYLERLVQQTYLRTGGGVDEIENALVLASLDGSEVASLEDRLQMVEDMPFVQIKDLESITVDTGDTAFTTTGDQFITCLNTAKATITLNPNPDDGEDVIVWPTAAQVTVSGSINGESSLVIPNPYDAPHLKYSLAAEEWAIV